MATVTNVCPLTAIAGAAFTADDYCLLVRIQGENGVGKMVKVTTATDTVAGVYALAGPAAKDDEISIWPLTGGSVLKVKAAEAITAGEVITPHTDGRVNGQSNLAGIGTGGIGIGVALKNAAVDEIFPIWAMPIAGSA